jgi:hypothetical protein
MLFIVSKQCACSRRVHIEGHMNRFEYCHPDNNSDKDSFGSFESGLWSSKWNKCRIYVGDQLDRCRWMERTQGSATRQISRWSGKDFALLLIGKFKLIIINCIAIDIILHSHFPFAGLLKFVFVYLTNTAVLIHF